jgi:hypothetical protein
VPSGTDIENRAVGVPVLIPVERCTLGWRRSLVQLAPLVEVDLGG